MKMPIGIATLYFKEISCEVKNIAETFHVSTNYSPVNLIQLEHMDRIWTTASTRFFFLCQIYISIQNTYK